ncbi:MAG: FAD/NAD(P)-binding protein [Bdellovibrionales bacterium]|nr:FAD/NAD(P)-binding protein [Bdellovibrionales bacterium]
MKSKNSLLPVPYRIVKCTQETSDVFTIELVPEDSQQSMEFSPGQFNMLYQFGVGEVPISISGDSAKADRYIHTIRAVGTVTRRMKILTEKSQLGLRGPFGVPWPLDKALEKDIFLIAGGIGLAPLRPVIYAYLANKSRYGRLSVLYGARSPKDLVFKKEFSQWRKLGVELSVAVDAAGPSWKGHVGAVTKLIPNLDLDPKKSLVMVCGPEIMMRFIADPLLGRGIAERDIYVSMERNMQCAVGFCGHCQYGGEFICKDGPVFSFDRLSSTFLRREF